jgi:bacterioferritin
MSAFPADLQWEQAHPFLNNVADIRRRARLHMQPDAASADHAADREAVLRLLNAALATELACELRYRRYVALEQEGIADEVRHDFAKRAQEEQGHAEQIAARIRELGGEPNLAAPSAAGRSARERVEDEDLTDMLAEDLIAERIAIDTYGEIIRFVAERDPTTRRLFESILMVEQGHAQELASTRERIRRDARAAAAAVHTDHPVELPG